MKKKRRGFLEWIQSPEVGKYSGRITLAIFSMVFIGVAAVIKFSSVNADAVGVQVNENGINEVRMASIDYVFTYDESVSAEKKEAIRDYCYRAADAVKLLHMVNMRQHVVFTENKDEIQIEDGTTVYVPTSASPEDLWNALDTLE